MELINPGLTLQITWLTWLLRLGHQSPAHSCQTKAGSLIRFPPYCQGLEVGWHPCTSKTTANSWTRSKGHSQQCIWRSYPTAHASCHMPSKKLLQPATQKGGPWWKCSQCFHVTVAGIANSKIFFLSSPGLDSSLLEQDYWTLLGLNEVHPPIYAYIYIYNLHLI